MSFARLSLLARLSQCFEDLTGCLEMNKSSRMHERVAGLAVRYVPAGVQMEAGYALPDGVIAMWGQCGESWRAAEVQNRDHRRLVYKPAACHDGHARGKDDYVLSESEAVNWRSWGIQISWSRSRPLLRRIAVRSNNTLRGRHRTFAYIRLYLLPSSSLRHSPRTHLLVMAVPRSEYLSKVWADGIFGEFHEH